MRNRIAVTLTLLIAALLSVSPGVTAEFPEIKNSQKPGEEPGTAAEAAAKFTVPEGFKVTLFAGEPDVQQPIAFEIDDRGRLWVAENYTYQGRGFTEEFNDRIIILEDKDQDGKFDKRSVFWDQGKRLSGVALGFGGAWALNNGQLIFIPDKDKNDKPDGEPVTMLDGFDIVKASHNIVNGLMWGPDGWLYGRQGIQANSAVGAPGMPDDQRTKINCGIWRYHPVKHVFEAVAHGTTNPWGMDYDQNGQFFFTNNVIGHLWHVVPGAHYKRMYGQPMNPNFYELIDQTGDHFHWDTSKKWNKARDAKGKTDEAGGGHSHCGGMIYQGDNWPKQYRGQMFMCNTHGRRVNVNVLERKGVGYVGKAAPDFLHANQPWFRGTELKYGPDGGVYITDWTDHGECHDNDGVHRTSGRIYKVVYGTPKKLPANFDLSKLKDLDLLGAQFGENAWHARHARRILMERDAARVKVNIYAADQYDYDKMPTHHQLRWNWIGHQLGLMDHSDYIELLKEKSEHHRAWAIRFAVDDPKAKVSTKVFNLFVKHAKTDTSGLVRLTLASALQRLPIEKRWELATALAKRAEDASDPVQPLMIWYGIEPAVAKDRVKALKLAKATTLPKLRRFIAQRIAGK